MAYLRIPSTLLVAFVVLPSACSEAAPANGTGAGGGVGAGAGGAGAGGLGAGVGGAGMGGAVGVGGAGAGGVGFGGTVGGAGMSGGAGAGGMAGLGGAGAAGMGGIGAAGLSGAGGTAAGGTSGSGGATASPGCGTAVSQDAATWVAQPNMDVQGESRQWWTWVPENYDPMRAYPVVVLLHGCGGDDNNVPVQRSSGEDAILVRGRGDAASTCWNFGSGTSNLEFFDGMVDAMFTNYCADESRVFVGGYSSGSWLTSRLACDRADRIRAVATVAGGNAGNQCAGNVAALLISDTGDMDNPQWAGRARSRIGIAC